MDGAEGPAIGSISHVDLTVADAGQVRDFYHGVVGWSAAPVSMGEYDDFIMSAPSTGAPVSGICYARGENADLPPRWLIYITVADADESARRCAELGGRVIAGPRALGEGRFCVIEDPAGAVAALYAPAG